MTGSAFCQDTKKLPLPSVRAQTPRAAAAGAVPARRAPTPGAALAPRAPAPGAALAPGAPPAGRGPVGQTAIHARLPGQYVSGRYGAPRSPALSPRLADRYARCRAGAASHCGLWQGVQSHWNPERLDVARRSVLLGVSGGRFVQSVGGITLVIQASPPRQMDVVLLPPDTATSGYSEYQGPPRGNVAFSYLNFEVQPRNAQGDARTDQYQCHRVGVSQSGFDPTLAASGGDPSVYWGVLVKCLEARGYSTNYPGAIAYGGPSNPPSDSQDLAAVSAPVTPPGQQQGSTDLYASGSQLTPPVAKRICRYVNTQVATTGDSDTVQDLYCEDDQGDWAPAQPAPARS